MGWYALSASTTNGSNTAIGAVSQRFSTGGTGNTSIGEASLFSVTTGDFNSAVGQSALGGLTDGANNVAIGYYAGATLGDGATDNTTSDNSIYIGSTAYASQSNGQNEIVIGAATVGHGSNTVTLGNTSITRTILRGSVILAASASIFTPTSSFGQSIFIGSGGGVNSLIIGGTSGLYNYGFGNNALASITYGDSNVAIGFNAMSAAIGSQRNIALGAYSLNSLTDGFNNFALGDFALRYITTQSGNVAIGTYAGSFFGTNTPNTGSESSLYLGYITKTGQKDAINEIVIGFAAIGNGSNSVTLGSTSITKTILRANVGIGNTNPTHSLTVQGFVTASAFTGSFRGDGSALTGVVASATPGGVDTTVQFNDAGATSGSTSFTFDKTTNTVKIQGSGSTLLHISGSRGNLLTVSDSGSLATLAAFTSGSVNLLEVRNTGIKITGSLEVSTSFTASLQSGYVWVGGSNGRTIAISTSSIGGGGGATTLAGLSDVTISAPENGQVLVYSASLWTNETRQLRAAFTADIANTWANMPNAVTFFDSSAAFIQEIDLSGFYQCRLLVNKLGTSGAAASKLILRYRTAYSQTATAYSDIGTSEVSVATNVTNTYLDSGWITLAAAARANVFVTVLGSGGDAAADPIFGHIIAVFR
jgi:hypothetical protein